jgi:hypothetical protein
MRCQSVFIRFCAYAADCRSAIRAADHRWESGYHCPVQILPFSMNVRAARLHHSSAKTSTNG